MCGIVGINKNIDDSLFNKALQTISHRGPDNQSLLHIDDCTLGHTRLSIIDLDSEANQPMLYDGIAIVFNGEIYNYQELKKEYKLECKTKSDTEVLIRLYQKFGINFLDKLNGMFAFCIYDTNTKKLFLARDRFGKKPLYYYHTNNTFIFASEIKAILAILPTTPPLNKQALYEYLSFMTPLVPNTFYDGIYKLPAGHFMLVENNITISKYYDIDEFEYKIFDEKQALTDIEALLIQSTQLRLVGDVEVATLLSGGIDSSFTSSMYARLSNKKINTFSIGYDEYLHYSELDYAKIVAKHIDSNHHEIIMTKQSFIDTIDKMLSHTDEPMADSASIPTYLLSQYIHNQGIKVALSGEGSDESFLGYDLYFKLFKFYKIQDEVSQDNKSFLNSYHQNNFNLSKDWEYFNRTYNNTNIYQTMGETFTQIQQTKLFKSYNTLDHTKDYILKNYDCTKWVSYIDFKIWIAEVLMNKIDRMSMAHSLELRAPFLDHNLVEYLMQVAPNIKMGDTNKYLLKKIAINYLPEQIVYRQKKGFSSPFIEWLYDEYKDSILEDILEVNKELDIFNEDFVKFLYNEAKHTRFKQHIWSLYLFAKWYKRTYL